MPWRATPDRIPAFERCTRYWLNHGYRVVCADSDPQRRFNRSTARNNAILETSTDVVILADADTLPANITQIRQAVTVAADGVVVRPYDHYRLLPADAVNTANLATVTPIRQFISKWRPASIIVTTRETYTTVGGFDPLFWGWGYEDSAFWMAAQTLAAVDELAGTVYAFNHTARRTRDPRNKSRHWWYRQAQGKRDDMHRLTDRARRRLNAPVADPGARRRFKPGIDVLAADARGQSS